MSEYKPSDAEIERAEALRAAIVALDVFLDTLPPSDARAAAKEHFAAFAFFAGTAAGLALRQGALQ